MDDMETRTIFPSRKRYPWLFPLVASILSAVGGLLFGYDTGVISGAMIQLRQQFALSYFYQELLVSITLVSAAVAALLCAWLTDYFGRKPVILLASFIFTVGATILGASFSKELLLVGRLIVGFGIGMASMAVPVYIAEIAPNHLRGTLVTLNSVCITAGQMIAAIIDGLFMGDAHNGWRYMLALGGVPSLIQFFGFLVMPETPRWLVEHGRIAEARAVLMRFHGEREMSNDTETELQRIVEASSNYQRISLTPHPITDTDSTTDLDHGEPNTADDTDLVELSQDGPRPSCIHRLTIVRMLKNTATRRALFIGCSLQLFQQFVGINTVMYYSASIISMAGIGATSNAQNRDTTVVWLAALVASANFVFCSFSPWLISRLRRRTLLLWSLAGVCTSLVVLAVSFQLIAAFSAPVDLVEPAPLGAALGQCYRTTTCDSCMRTSMCGYCYQWFNNKVVNGSCLPALEHFAGHSAYGRCANQTFGSNPAIWAFDHCPTPFGWLTVLGLVMYLASFAPGMASLPWTINSELYPTWARSTGVACSTGTNWITNVVVSLSFLSLTEAITRQGTYFLYAVIALLAILFVYKCVPETGNITLEEVASADRRDPDRRSR